MNAHSFTTFYWSHAIITGLAVFSLSSTLTNTPNAPEPNETSAKNHSATHDDVCPPTTQKASFTSYVSDMLQSASSLPLQALLALLLGLLMSLTPCIYPMIPITMGVLQAQGARSMGRSFMLALSYTLGIACTFAALGLAAVFSGQLFGSLATHPLISILMALFMFYLAGTMFGLYEMHIPRFLQSPSGPSKGGSILSAFTIGAVSGTVASPCLSPGLLLLLGIVASIGSTLAGFVLLFSFGFGIGLPLLLIGTFSGSLSMLPRAGAWMVEVKRLFGILLIAMGLYYLRPLLGERALWIIAGICAWALSTAYLMLAGKSTGGQRMWGRIMSALSSIFLVLYIGPRVIGSYTSSGDLCKPEALQWANSYDCARQQAIEQNKLLFVDIGAPSCSVCHAIDAEILSDTLVECELERYTVPLKINTADTKNESTNYVMSNFSFFGVPTLLLIEPTTEKVLHTWGSELYEQSPPQFIQTLKTYTEKAR